MTDFTPLSLRPFVPDGHSLFPRRGHLSHELLAACFRTIRVSSTREAMASLRKD